MDRINQRTDHRLGKNIKRLRLEHGLQNCEIVTQLQLKGVYITRSIYAKVEKGYNNPSVELIVALADFYEISFDEFFKPIETNEPNETE